MFKKDIGDKWEWCIPQTAFKVGQRVRCRNTGEEWQEGVVTAEAPLKVRPDDFDSDGSGYEWNHVEECTFGMFVKSITGQMIAVDITSNSKIDKIKQTVFEKEGIPVGDQRL